MPTDALLSSCPVRSSPSGTGLLAVDAAGLKQITEAVLVGNTPFQSTSGSRARSAVARGDDVIDISDYCVADGTHDDTSGFQYAVAAAAGKTLRLHGSINLSSTVNITASMRIIGNASFVSLSPTGTLKSQCRYFYITSSDVVVEFLTFTANSSMTPTVDTESAFVYVQSADRVHVRNCIFDSVTTSTVPAMSSGLVFLQCNQSGAEHCVFRCNGLILAMSGGSGNAAYGNRIYTPVANGVSVVNNNLPASPCTNYKIELNEITDPSRMGIETNGYNGNILFNTITFSGAVAIQYSAISAVGRGEQVFKNKITNFKKTTAGFVIETSNTNSTVVEGNTILWDSGNAEVRKHTAIQLVPGIYDAQWFGSVVVKDNRVSRAFLGVSNGGVSSAVVYPVMVTQNFFTNCSTGIDAEPEATAKYRYSVIGNIVSFDEPNNSGDIWFAISLALNDVVCMGNHVYVDPACNGGSSMIAGIHLVGDNSTVLGNFVDGGGITSGGLPVFGLLTNGAAPSGDKVAQNTFIRCRVSTQFMTNFTFAGNTLDAGLWAGASQESFFNNTPATQPVVTGSRAASDAVALSLLTALTSLGLVTNSTTA